VLGRGAVSDDQSWLMLTGPLPVVGQPAAAERADHAGSDEDRKRRRTDRGGGVEVADREQRDKRYRIARNVCAKRERQTESRN